LEVEIIVNILVNDLGSGLYHFILCQPNEGFSFSSILILSVCKVDEVPFTIKFFTVVEVLPYIVVTSSVGAEVIVACANPNSKCSISRTCITVVAVLGETGKCVPSLFDVQVDWAGS
jgi:hypothetical protein